MTQMTTYDGTPVSPFAFGTMQFGGRADAPAARAMFDASCAAGINHFDTAYLYTDGASETMLGQFAKARRSALFIATKVAYDRDASAQAIQTQFDECRRRLGMESVDLLYLHRFPKTDLEHAIETLATMQQAGSIRYIGLSNFAAWQVMKTNAIAKTFGTQVDAIQPMYNLVKRQAEVELLPMCASEDIACVPYSPLGGGLLTGKYGQGKGGRLTEDDRYNARYAPDWMHGAADALSACAKDMGVDPATLAAAWAAKHPAKPMPILSARSAAQLAPSLAAMQFDMDEALYQKISGFSQTPPPATDRIDDLI